MCSSHWNSWSSRAASLVGNQMGRQKTQGKPVARYHLRNAGTKTDPGDPALVPLEILVHRGLRGWRRHRSGSDASAEWMGCQSGCQKSPLERVLEAKRSIAEKVSS